MKHPLQKFRLPACAAALLLALTACGGWAPSFRQEESAPIPMESTKAPQPERPAWDAFLLDGVQTRVYPEIRDEEILLWDQPAGGSQVAAAQYPATIPNAAQALSDWDLTDLDGDGNSELSLGFRFQDGTSASLLWFFFDGEYVWNEEFSRLPGDAAAGEP